MLFISKLGIIWHAFQIFVLLFFFIFFYFTLMIVVVEGGGGGKLWRGKDQWSVWRHIITTMNRRRMHASCFYITKQWQLLWPSRLTGLAINTKRVYDRPPTVAHYIIYFIHGSYIGRGWMATMLGKRRDISYIYIYVYIMYIMLLYARSRRITP